MNTHETQSKNKAPFQHPEKPQKSSQQTPHPKTGPSVKKQSTGLF